MLVDKRMLFKVEVNDSNLYLNWCSYTVKKVTADNEIIKQFISQLGINLGNDEEEADYIEAVSKLADNKQSIGRIICFSSLSWQITI